MIVVEGHSGAGKTRFAARALQVQLADRLLFAPDNAGSSNE
jgi:hypothetical protein